MGYLYLFLHYFVKVVTQKMRVNSVNINSSFNVYYEIAIKCIRFH